MINAYKLDLPVDFGVSPTFNIVDLKPYLAEDDELQSRTTQIQEGKDDEDIATNDRSTPTPVSTSPTPLMETRALLFYSGTMDWIQREEVSRRLDSDYRTDTTCDGRHDFIRTPFWSFKYFLESLSNILSKGSRITSISIRNQPQSSIYYRVFSATVLHHPILAQWAMYQVESNSDAS
jgi:hypothetical protein